MVFPYEPYMTILLMAVPSQPRDRPGTCPPRRRTDLPPALLRGEEPAAAAAAEKPVVFFFDKRHLKNDYVMV